jgi:NitT/TauT family transport system substrate-binding protein
MAVIRIQWFAVFNAVFALWSTTAMAETSTIRVAQQFGLGYLPLMIMEDQKLVEKAVEAAGLPAVTVT